MRMRVESMETRYANAVSELVGTFERMATDPNLVSSKEVVKAIDLGDRALKNTKAACASILKTLDAKTKSIEAEHSFTEDQKAELLAAVESMTVKVAEVSMQCAATIEHLGGAYKAMGKWRTIHKTYLDLDGEAKAKEQLKASVDEFVKGLTAEPGAFDAVPAKVSKQDSNLE